MIPEAMQQTWDDAHGALGLETNPEGLNDLVARYREPHRVYHNLTHIVDCLALLETHRHLAQRPHEVALAILFHDAVYDPLRSDNEAQSAALAQARLHRAPQHVVERVTHMILATASHGADDDADVRLLLDIDLAILGAAPSAFQAFEDAIAQEYAMVPPDVFRAGRRWLLERFLTADRLFQTDAVEQALGPQARRNLTARIASLESEP